MGTTFVHGVVVERQRVAELLCDAVYGPGNRERVMPTYGTELGRQADILIAGLADAPMDNGATCTLCAGKCRHHRLGHPGDWHPEPGSQAYRHLDTYMQAIHDSTLALRANGYLSAADLVATLPVDQNLPPLRSKSIIDAAVLAAELSDFRQKKIVPKLRREGIEIDGTLHGKRGELTFRSAFLVKWQQLDIHHDALVAAVKLVDRRLSDQWRKQGGR